MGDSRRVPTEQSCSPTPLRGRNLAAEIEREVAALADRRAFGILAPRGEMPKACNERLWLVTSIDPSSGAAEASLEAGHACRSVPLRSACDGADVGEEVR